MRQDGKYLIDRVMRGNNFKIEILTIIIKISTKMVYYSVHKGTIPGIYITWKDCKKNITGYPKPIYKKFECIQKAGNFLMNGWETPSSAEMFVYTDGACSNNGKIGAKAGIGVYFGEDDKRNVSESIPGKQTNNTAELSAMIKALTLLKDETKEVCVFTDSKYVLLCCGSYGSRMNKENWVKEIANKELVKTVYNLKKNKPNITLRYVKAHTNNTDQHSIGNARADALALKGCN